MAIGYIKLPACVAFVETIKTNFSYELLMSTSWIVPPPSILKSLRSWIWWPPAGKRNIICKSIFEGFVTWRIMPISKWLGSPPFISHGVWPFGRGITPVRGRKRSPWLLTTYPSPGMILQVGIQHFSTIWSSRFPAKPSRSECGLPDLGKPTFHFCLWWCTKNSLIFIQQIYT